MPTTSKIAFTLPASEFLSTFLLRNYGPKGSYSPLTNDGIFQQDVLPMQQDEKHL